MATPTPSQPVKQETPSSLNNHLSAFSPTGRSVAHSPANVSKKSPANLAFQNQHLTGSSNPGGVLAFDSPNVAALGLNLSLNDLGHISNHPSRPDDEERRRRLELILNRLEKCQVRISQDGAETLAKRTNLEMFWENGLDHQRTLNIAGRSLFIEVHFKHNTVTEVSLSFPKSPEPVTATVPLAAKILKDDLQPPPGVAPFNTSLSRFAENLGRLARLDKLSAPPELDCYAAIAGIYASLHRLFCAEKQKVETEYSLWRNVAPQLTADERFRRVVLCKKSGRPNMHASKTVGLRLDYWMDRRLTAVGEEDDYRDANVASNEGKLQPDKEADTARVWSMIVECEGSPAELYPPVRTSDQWLPEAISLETDMFNAPHDSTINWSEPNEIFIPSAVDPSVDPVTATLAKRPAVRFVAKLSPPVTVPLAVAYRIFNIVGHVVADESMRIFDEMVFPKEPSESSLADGEVRQSKVQRDVEYFAQDGGKKEAPYDFTFFVHKQDYGRLIEEIPFSHPRQLVEIMPILRQYIVAINILQSTLKRQPSPPPQSKEEQVDGEDEEGNLTLSNGYSAKLELEDELALLLREAGMPPSNPASAGPPRTAVDITMSTGSNVTISTRFTQVNHDTSLVFIIGPNGDLTATTNLGSLPNGIISNTSDAKVARMLETVEDIGTLVQFLRTR